MAMVVVSMNLMPLKTIGRKICLWARGIYGPLKDLGSKRCPNI
jgi:hypothetical protein